MSETSEGSDRLARIEHAIEALAVTVAGQLRSDDRTRTSIATELSNSQGRNERILGATEVRLANLEKSVDGLNQKTDAQTTQLDVIQNKLNRMFGFAGGIGTVAGIASAWIIRQFKP